MQGRNRSLDDARDKRELAAFVRRIAGTISLDVDRNALLAQAAAIEAEADEIEKKHRDAAQ